jgi:acetyltransferase-like isoleucine patch superfamily enzyme
MSLAPLFDAVGEDTVIHPGVEVFRQGESGERGIFVGSHCILYPRNRFVLGDMNVNLEADLRIGDHVLINAGGYLSGEGGLFIGDYTLIGPSVCLLSAGHEFQDLDKPVQFQNLTYGRIEIGRDVWIGAQVVILPGVRVGDHAVVAAGSVVTEDVPPRAVVAGNPARRIRFRGEAPQRSIMRRIGKAWNALRFG